MRLGEIAVAASVMIILTGQGSPAPAQEDLQGGLQSLVSQMIASMEQQHKQKLAVLDFTRLDGSLDNFGRYLAERLITSMFMTHKFAVMERRQLDKILAELRLNLSDVIDPKNAKRLGRLHGVDAIATGSVTVLEESVEVNARLIESESGKVFSVATVRFAKDKDVAALLGSSPGPSVSSATSKGSQVKTRIEEPPFFDRFRNQTFSIAYTTTTPPRVVAVTGQVESYRILAFRGGERVAIKPHTVREILVTTGRLSVRRDASGPFNRATVLLRDGRKLELEDVEFCERYKEGSSGCFFSRIYFDDVNAKVEVKETWIYEFGGFARIVFLD